MVSSPSAQTRSAIATAGGSKMSARRYDEHIRSVKSQFATKTNAEWRKLYIAFADLMSTNMESMSFPIIVEEMRVTHALTFEQMTVLLTMHLGYQLNAHEPSVDF